MAGPPGADRHRAGHGFVAEAVADGMGLTFLPRAAQVHLLDHDDGVPRHCEPPLSGGCEARVAALSRSARTDWGCCTLLPKSVGDHGNPPARASTSARIAASGSRTRK